MKKIENGEYKKIILDILRYIDGVCRENNIEYSLAFGSLIGAIREKGIIPWDDDIDIIMDKKEYDKLFCIISNDKNSKYQLLDNTIDNTYPITYAKMIDTRTIISEPRMIQYEKYGAFVDIFVNHNAPNNSILRRFQFFRLKIIQSLINGCIYNESYAKTENLFKRIRTKIAKKIGVVKLQKKYRKIISKYDNKETNYKAKDYIGSNYKKYIMPSDFFNEYIDVDFEDMKAMSIKKYDENLKMIFGDYMTRPPKDKQVCHNIEAYWRD